ncbi:hypothetical protein ABW19_dt0203060 [Dactylella cylindrospora]|nr:hypothetical protein ABW19_dt0203060 [Dactylella cylindrospora]
MSSSTSSLSSLSSSSSGYHKPRIALVGSGGLLGEATLNTLLSPEFFDAFAKPIRVLTTNASKVPPAGNTVTYCKIYWDEADLDHQLTRALRGSDIVVNLLGYDPDLWGAVTRAVCMLKPQLYIPPEFSFDHTLWDEDRIPRGSIIDYKQRQTDLARAAGVHTVQIFCGFIMEGIFPDNSAAGIEFTQTGRRILAVAHDGNIDQQISFISSWDVGHAIAYVASNPNTKDEQIHISGDTGTWNRVARILKASIRPIDATNFEETLNRDSRLEFFMRVAAADGDLHFSSSRRRGVIPNENYKVDPKGNHNWLKLGLVARGIDMHHDKNAQPNTSGPEDSTSKDTKQKRGGSDSASSESDAQQQKNSNENSQNESPNIIEDQASQSQVEPETQEQATSATSKPKTRAIATPKPRSSILAARARQAHQARETTQQASPAVLENRIITRSMAKHQTPSTPTANTSSPSAARVKKNKRAAGRDAEDEKATEGGSETNSKTNRQNLAASARRNKKRRKVG